MSEFDIVLIKENMFKANEIKHTRSSNYDDISGLDTLKVKSKYLDYEESLKLIDDICEVHTVNKDNFMENVHSLIKLDENHYGDVKDCYECEGYLYQIIYMLTHNEDTDLSENLLASSLTFEKRLFFGNAVLFRIKHSSLDDSENNFISTSKKNVLELLMNNYYHTGITVSPDNKFNQIFFNNKLQIVDPESNWSVINNEFNFMTNTDYGYQYKEILGYKLNIIFRSNNEENANEPLSRLLEGIVKGNGIIISPYSESNFYDITVNDIVNILKLYNELNYKETDYEKIGVDSKSKYQIVASRIKNV